VLNQTYEHLLLPGADMQPVPHAAAHAPDLRAASWPLPASSGNWPLSATTYSHHRMRSSHPDGSAQPSGFAGGHFTAAASAGPLGQGLAALSQQPVAEDNLSAQQQAQHEQQQPWWQAGLEEQRQQEVEQRQRWWQQQQGAAQQPLLPPWLPEQHAVDPGQCLAADSRQTGFGCSSQPWWQQQQQQLGSQQQQRMPEASASSADMPQRSVTQVPAPRQAQRPEQVQLSPEHLRRGLAEEQQYAQGVINVGGADGTSGSAAGSSDPAAGSGALWSAFFEFPEDSDLTDCHPALLQVMVLLTRCTFVVDTAWGWLLVISD
jgi:hypothetical protein